MARVSYLQRGRSRLFLREVGQGQPIVVVHGGPDFGHDYLLPGMDLLADRYRLVYYDQRGRGRSFGSEGPDDVTIQSEMDDLDAVRASIAAPSVAVLGHSFGGLFAMEYAIRHPSRVSHLILMDSAPASHAGAVALRRELAVRRSPEQSARMRELIDDPAYRRGDLGPDAEYYRIHFGTTLHRPVQLDAVVDRLRQGSTPEGIVAARAIEGRLYAQTWDQETYDLLPELRSLRMPTLVITGDRDFCLAACREVAAAIPSARLVVLEDCGHFAYLEQPDLVRSLITDLLG